MELRTQLIELDYKLIVSLHDFLRHVARLLFFYLLLHWELQIFCKAFFWNFHYLTLPHELALFVNKNLLVDNLGSELINHLGLCNIVVFVLFILLV